MANRRNKTRLELTWIGKEDRPKLEPRILLEDPEKSYHASVRRPGDIFDNMLIHGDNLLALKALEADFAGQVKCVFIDPPYNTGSAFEHYDDGVEHSLWLSLMRDRLECIRALMRNDGLLWITIDDNEAHYLKVLCDEIFGRSNFLADVSWQKVYSERMDSTGFSKSCDHVLCYGRSSESVVRQLPLPQNLKQFNYFDDAAGRHYRRRSLRKEGSESRRQDRPSMWYPVTCPDGTEVLPYKPDGSEGRWRWKEENVQKRSDELDFVQTADGWQVYVKQYAAETPTRPPNTLWLQDDVGHNHEAKLEVQALNPADVFSTPKPERLIHRILQVATTEGDLVLDSFAGSGTTGAVAHKMGRQWIMVELGQHAETHVQPRMIKVIDAEDRGGVSTASKWEGGGGFRYYTLAPSLLQKDDYGNWIINKDYNAAMLAEALCKIEGFKYEPSPEVYWQQGRSTETDYIYITTQMMTADMLQNLSDEVGQDRSLLIMCKAFRSKREWANLTVKKIPKAILAKCEWGHDDYSLEIKELPVIEDEPDETEGGAQVEPKSSGKAKSKRRKAAAVAGGNLFSADETEDGEDN